MGLGGSARRPQKSAQNLLVCLRASGAASHMAASNKTSRNSCFEPAPVKTKGSAWSSYGRKTLLAKNPEDRSDAASGPQLKPTLETETG